MTPLEQVTLTLKQHGSRRVAKDWQCPAHDDARASLSVSEGRDGRVVLHCHAGCDPEQVVTALGLTMADLFEAPSANGNRHKPTISTTYDYHDEQGRLLFQVVRFFPKDFRQRRPLSGGGWEWKLGDTRRVLYHLPALREAVAGDELVYVVEGEKDVHAIEAVGGRATCNPGGAGKWRPEYAETLRGAHVVVVADADEPGHRHAQEVAASLQGKAASVRVVEPVAGKDAADHLAAGYGLGDFLGAEQAEPPSEAAEPTTPADKLKARLLTADQLVNLPPPSFLIDDLLNAASLAVLYGKPGSGKSFVALDWALCVACGLPWAARETKKGPVLYIAAEGIGGLGVRVRAWQHAFNVPAVSGICFLPGAVNLLEQDRTAPLVEVCRQLEPSLIVVDTMARSMVGGDENSARDVGLVVDSADRLRQATGACVLIVHHTTKDGANYRGNSALEGGVDTMIEVAADDDQITLKSEKAKDAPNFRDISLHRDVIELGEGLSSCVIRHESPTDKLDRLSGASEAVVRLLSDDYRTTGASVPTLVEATGLARAYVYQVVNALAKDGLIHNIGSDRAQHWKVVES